MKELERVAHERCSSEWILKFLPGMGATVPPMGFQLRRNECELSYIVLESQPSGPTMMNIDSVILAGFYDSLRKCNFSDFNKKMAPVVVEDASLYSIIRDGEILLDAPLDALIAFMELEKDVRETALVVQKIFNQLILRTLEQIIVK